MTHDNGFAPNPFWGELTLATCKPHIRFSKEIGDWIAGFTSRKVCGDPVGGEKLVYLMQVETKLLIAQYFSDPRYRNKIPDLQQRFQVHRVGDNIYRPVSSGKRIEQLPNEYHSCGDSKYDLSGKFVLISSKFRYFGRAARTIPDDIRPEVPSTQHPHGRQTHDEHRARAFIDFVFRIRGSAVEAAPYTWPTGDSSWNHTYNNT
jgi:hypothetical protein